MVTEYPTVYPSESGGRQARRRQSLAVGTGERGEVGSQSQWAGTWGENWGGSSQSLTVDVGGHSGERRGGGAGDTRARSVQLGGEAVTVTHSGLRHLLEAPG